MKDWQALLTAVGAMWQLAGCAGETGDRAEGAPTYHRDVAPILAASCAGCHVAGGIAPFALTTYEEARAHAAAIEAAVTAGTMPPWPPSRDCSSYARDRSLSQADIETLSAWARGGAKEGPREDATTPTKPADRGLSRVDLELSLPEAYTPVTAPDDYRCFLVDWPETTTKYVTGLGVLPDRGELVHHVIVYHAAPGEVARYQDLDDADPGAGWACFGGPGGTTQSQLSRWLGGWVPGSKGADSPAGTGIEIEPQSKLVVQMHYNTSAAKPAPDKTSILFKLDSEVASKAAVMPFTNPDWVMNRNMPIPAHASDAKASFSADVTPYLSFLTAGALPSGGPFKIWSAGLHMHTRGTKASARIERGGGEGECLLDIERWNFHWQGNYELARSTTVEPGDRLSLECHWDNPGATDMNWGEGTLDEMCLALFYVTP